MRPVAPPRRAAAWQAARVRRLLAITGALLAALLGAAPAGADEQPSILKAYDLDWIERVREEAWPQPKEQRPVICLLDTGVAVTPDTPETSAAGPIVARLAVDGGSGLPQGDEPLHQHGTQMASVIAAPRNDWGTVGVFPQARIVSIRVTHKTETHIAPEEMVKGVAECVRWAIERDLRVAVAVMAESNYEQRAADAPAWKEAAAKLFARGGAMVAAAGNAAAAELPVPPTGLSELISVGAARGDRAACSFAPAGVTPTLWGPGCQAAGWPSGSSTAAAVVGALVAAAVMRDPKLPVVDAAALRGVDGVASGSAVKGAFAGLISPVPLFSPGDTGVAGEISITREGGPTDDRQTRPWRPTAQVQWRGGWLRVRVAGGVPASGRVRVRVAGRVAGRVVGGPRGKKRFAVRWRKRPVRAQVWVEGERPAPWRSMIRQMKVGRG